MDRFGMNAMLGLKDRVATIAGLVKRGYLDRIALSHDCWCWSDFFPSEAACKAHFPEHSYLYVSQKVIPALLEAGLTQDQINAMLIDNPRRHFEDAARRFAAKT
jgi:phosphotriesterase-related protein